MADVTLVVRRFIRAEVAQVFAAWTEPASLQKWWGPPGVTCSHAEVDLRVGGSYRIANQLDDGSILWLTGGFEAIDPPHRLQYTWVMADGPIERVVVHFTARAGGTEITVRHEKIADEPTRTQHNKGWEGCLDGLALLLEA